MSKTLKLLLLCCLCLFSCRTEAKEKILYIPIDDRPVCLSYVQETVTAAGHELLLPPAGALSHGDKTGDTTLLWKWLENTAPKAKAAVISTDSLCYGGLVASRKHEFSDRYLTKQVERLQGLKELAPGLRIYAFSTIMRSPRETFGNVEPDYYQHYGPSIFRLSQLFDKEDMLGHITPREKKERDTLQRRIPAYLLQDWYKRRAKNIRVNEQLIDMTKKKLFYYLAIGKDDDAPFSQTHMEARHLSKKTTGLSEQKLQILPGVDQLGLLLLTRAINKIEGNKPKVHVIFAPGYGGKTISLYTDQTAASSAAQQITAIGGKKAPLKKADLVLAINTPFDGINKDSTSNDNASYVAKYNKEFALTLKNLVKSKPVAFADISYANGADNGFMAELSNRKLLDSLTAYSGWNTADNSIGYALAQGILAEQMRETDTDKLLKTRYLDDWLYQARIRRMLVKGIDRHNFMLKYDLKQYRNRVLKAAKTLYIKHINKEPYLKGTTFTAEFPWNRLFEIDIKLQ